MGRVQDPAGPVGSARACATVCYMSDRDELPSRVGVRELRQNLSVYLRRVKAGETLEVTEHGQPVAELRPRAASPLSVIDRMVAEGRITQATIDHRTLQAPPAAPGRPLAEIILEMRDEDDR